MGFVRRLRPRTWYPPFLAFWAVFFVSIPAMFALGGGGNFFEIVWWFATAWLTEPFWRAAFPFLLLGPAPLLLLPFALTLEPEDPASVSE